MLTNFSEFQTLNGNFATSGSQYNKKLGFQALSQSCFCSFVSHFYPPVIGGSSMWCLYFGRWVFTCSGDFQLQSSGFSMKSRLLLNLLLSWVPPGRDKHCKASYPRMLQHDEGVGWTRDRSILVGVKTVPLSTRQCCLRIIVWHHFYNNCSTC